MQVEYWIDKTNPGPLDFILSCSYGKNIDDYLSPFSTKKIREIVV